MFGHGRTKMARGVRFGLVAGALTAMLIAGGGAASALTVQAPSTGTVGPVCAKLAAATSTNLCGGYETLGVRWQ